MDSIDYSNHLKFPLVQLLVNKVLYKARDNILSDLKNHFNSLDSCKVLDFGVNSSDIGVLNNPFLTQSSELQRNPNYFCAGLDSPDENFSMKKKYIVIPEIDGINVFLPFKDNAFDLVLSNAVLEHIPRKLHIATLRELLRISKNLFISVPNRFFPIEHHTMYPLVHWAPFVFKLLLDKNDFFKSDDNLNFISKRYFKSLVKNLGSVKYKVGYTGIQFFPKQLSSNIYLIIEPKEDV